MRAQGYLWVIEFKDTEHDWQPYGAQVFRLKSFALNQLRFNKSVFKDRKCLWFRLTRYYRGVV